MADGFTGMADLIADLQRMGDAVEGEAANVVTATANATATQIRSEYPVKTGNLRNGVVIESISKLHKKVKSTAPHAFIVERGTVERFLHSTGASRGKMPDDKPIFIPAAIRHRARMVDALTAIVKRQKVRGMTGTLDVTPRGN
jgi:hypothetical protein